MTANKRDRKKKDETSDLYDETFSVVVTQLSVKERTRLIKAVAGTLSLVVVPPDHVLVPSKATTGKTQKPTGTGQARQQTQPPNPLKGSKVEEELLNAREKVRARKTELSVEKLPLEDSAFVAYQAALQAYKAEKEKAKLSPPAPLPLTAARIKNKRKASERSPERTETVKDSPQKGSSIFQSLKEAAVGKKRAKNPKPSQKADVMEEDEQHL